MTPDEDYHYEPCRIYDNHYQIKHLKPCCSQTAKDFEVKLIKERDLKSKLRIIGSRSRGIFVDFVEGNEDFHNEDIEGLQLKVGDQILYCNQRRLSGMTSDQAAWILRQAMSMSDTVCLTVRRFDRGAELMMRRKSLVSVAQEEEERWRMLQQENPFYGGTQQASMTYSRSLPTITKKRVFHVVPSQSSAYVRSYCDKVDEESDCESEETSSYNDYPNYNLPKSFYSFDTSDLRQKETCPICNKETRVRFLHILSHSWMRSAKRLLPISKSNSFSSTQYSLL